MKKIYSAATNKKVISINYGITKSTWKPWRWERLDLTLTMRDVNISTNVNPLTKLTSSISITEFNDILAWKISQINMKIIPISMRIVISYAIKQGIPFWVWQKLMETETTTWSKFLNEGKERNPKEQDWDSHSQRSKQES